MLLKSPGPLDNMRLAMNNEAAIVLHLGAWNPSHLTLIIELSGMCQNRPPQFFHRLEQISQSKIMNSGKIKTYPHGPPVGLATLYRRMWRRLRRMPVVQSGICNSALAGSFSLLQHQNERRKMDENGRKI